VVTLPGKRIALKTNNVTSHPLGVIKHVWEIPYVFFFGFHRKFQLSIPDAPCMEYLATFTLKIAQM
jgi:hypothetical protein